MVDKRTARARQGFTLVEMLCAIVVLLLVSMLMVTGVQLGVRSFSKSVSASEAQVLCSTLRTIVSDELRYAGTIDQSGETILFFSQNYGRGEDNKGVGFSTDENGYVRLGGKKILPNKSYPYGLRGEVTLESYDSRRRIFSVTITVTNSAGTELAQTQFEVGQLNEPADSESGTDSDSGDGAG